VMRHAREDRRGWRLRALIVVLWRARLRVQEALALTERDLDARRGSLLVRQGKGGRRREIGMDDWGWDSCSPGSPPASSSRSGRCSASSTVPPAGDPGQAPGPRRVPPARRPGRCQAPLRAAPAAPCTRRRARPRTRAAERHPAPARARESRHDLDLPRGHRHRRHHRHGPRATRPDDVGQRRTPDLKDRRREHPGAPARPGASRASAPLARHARSSSQVGPCRPSQSVSVASGRSKRCAKTAPWPRRRSLALRACSSSSAGVSWRPAEALGPERSGSSRPPCESRSMRMGSRSRLKARS
jgi:hypothetical protein